MIRQCIGCKEDKHTRKFYKGRARCKVCVLKENRVYYLRRRQYYLDHARVYRQGLLPRYRQVKYNSEKRGLEFNLTVEEYKSFQGEDCHYCGIKLEKSGIDRVDNKEGYVPWNCVPCCKVCNRMKRDMTVSEFIGRCNKIAILEA